MKPTKAITSILLVTLILMLSNMSAEAQRRRRHPSRYKRTPRIGHREHHNRDDDRRHGNRHAVIRIRHHHEDYRIHHRDYRHYREDHEHRSDHFYRRHRWSFFGIRIRILPPHYYRFEIGTHIYFYNRGNYYVYRHHYYEPVPPPIGARVDQLPEGCNKVVINGRIYYDLDGVYYKAYVDQNGEVWYEVVGINRKELNE